MIDGTRCEGGVAFVDTQHDDSSIYTTVYIMTSGQREGSSRGIEARVGFLNASPLVLVYEGGKTERMGQLGAAKVCENTDYRRTENVMQVGNNGSYEWCVSGTCYRYVMGIHNTLRVSVVVVCVFSAHRLLFFILRRMGKNKA